MDVAKRKLLNRTRAALSIPLLVIMATLVACGGSDAVPGTSSASPATPTPTPTPSVIKDARYGSLDQLKTALTDSGYPCEDWNQDNVVKLAAESGTCSDSDVIMTFAVQSDLDDFIDGWRSISDLTEDSDPIIVGPNWVLNIPESYIIQMQSQLGGTVLNA